MNYSDSDNDEFIDQKHIEGSTLEMLEELRHPFNLIVRIQVIRQGKKWFGTGCVVQQCIVLTCLHNLLDQQKPLPPSETQLVQPSEIKVYLGQNGSVNVSQEYEVLDFKYNPHYFSKSKFNKNSRKEKAYDYAMLLLNPKNQPMIDPKNKLTISIPETLDAHRNKKIHKFELYGYDSTQNQLLDKQYQKKNEFRLFGCQTDMLNMNDNFIDYRVTTYSGKSGAPLISYCRQGLFKIIGIHLAYNSQSDYNFALRINEQVIKCIRKWMMEWQKGDQILNPLTSKLHIHGQDELSKKISRNSMYQLQNHKENYKKPSLLESLFRVWFKFTQSLKVYEEKNIQDHETVFIQHKQPKEKQYQSPKLFKSHSTAYHIDKQMQVVAGNARSQILQSLPQPQPLKTLTTKDQIQKFTKCSARQLSELSYKNGSINISLLPQHFLNIKLLKLNNCNIDKVPSFANLNKLQSIDCSKNLIVQMSGFLTKYIIHLQLDQNLIKQVPQAIIEAKSLRTLSLNHNQKLQRIHPNILKIKLSDLYIQGSNRLYNDSQMVNKLDDLDTINLHQDP